MRKNISAMSADPDVPWDLVSQVRRSRRKTDIINRLGDEPACASEMSDEMGIQTDSVSNVLRELKNTDPPLIECLTPNQPHHRIYGLTEVGATVLDHV